MKTILTAIILLLAFGASSSAQFQLLGTAEEQMMNEFRITHNANYVTGALWSEESIDLQQRFELHFELMLGCENNGGAGLAFVMQKAGFATLGSGAGDLGFAGLRPCLAVEFDTYMDEFDVPHDHIAIMKNGPNHHSDNHLAGPVIANFALVDIEDCKNHKGKIIWEPGNQTLYVYFDGMMRLSYRGDIVKDIFYGSSTVYWGFTGSTGCTTNTQIVKILPTPPAPLEVEVKLEQPACGLGDMGSAKVTTNRWGSKYSCKWSTGDSYPEITNLEAGEYSVTVTNEWGEQVVKFFNIHDGSPIELEVDEKQRELIEVTGGQAPYQIITLKEFVIADSNSKVLYDKGEIITENVETLSFEVQEGAPNPRSFVEDSNPGRQIYEFLVIKAMDVKGCVKRHYFPIDKVEEVQPPVVEVPEPPQAPKPEIVENIPEVVNPVVTELTELTSSEGLGMLNGMPIIYEGDKPVSIGDRKIIHKKSKVLPVRSKVIKITVWDTEEIDGDIVSLNYNGRWILQNYQLKRKKKKLRVQLVPDQDNYLILYAHNEGSRPPNTAAFAIVDSRGVQHIALSSDLESCGTINFNYRE